MIEHHFWPGVYGKRTLMPAGTIGVQHSHTYDHCSILKRGMAAVDGKVYSAPACIVIPAHRQHRVEAITDAEWWCIHPTDETDPAQVDAGLIEGGA